MILRCFLLILLLPLVLAEGVGQSVEKQSSRKKVAAPSALERAASFREEDPAAAIRILSELIQSKPNTAELTEAFLLLGDIYADIGQEELALGRYERALELITDPQSLKAADLYRRRGGIFLRQANYQEARTNFGQCLSIAPAGSAPEIACQEGLADLEASTNNLAQSQNYYSRVQESNPRDSLLQVRVNTKRADVYLQQNDLKNSVNSLEEAISQVPQNQELPKQEASKLIATNRKLRGAVLKEDPSLDKELVDVLPSKEIPLLATDNFTRFKALREMGREEEAATKLAAAVNNISPTTAPEITTEIYAEGADFYLDRGQTELAADYYRNYTNSNDQLLAEKRRELDLQVDILREQQAVDLGLKDLAAAEQEDRFLSQQVQLQRWLIYLLGALLLGALFSVMLILRNVRKRRRANQELLLRNLQTRMNPHFIFNSLNSINNYIAQQDERSANRYLGRFAKLMRNVLDQSGKDFVPLSEELEQLALYLELEKERFGGQFNYRIIQHDSVDTESIQLPPMILQ
ncbi:MAG: histidine kinase, partial [Bacteroidota bacterium]